MAKRGGGNLLEQADVVVVNAQKHPLRDIYYLMLSVAWWRMLLMLSAAFLVVNAIFAGIYCATGGVEGARDGSFVDAFFFSAQTLGTIGYGAMHPQGFGANVAAVAESLVSILFIAVATGLVFTRFSRSTESVIFSEYVSFSPMDGVPTLFIRIGNDREGAIMDAVVRLTMFRTHKTAEGTTMYRMTDLKLARERTSALGRTFTIMHHVTEDSPLFKTTPADWENDEIELLINVVGTDDTLLQPVYARTRYLAHEVKWGTRFVDVLSELPDGKLQLDVRHFDSLVDSKRTDDFPYPVRSASSDADDHPEAKDA